MGKKLVLVNVDFKDVYTGKLHKAGDREEMTDERVMEVKAINPDFVTVIGAAEEDKDPGKEDPGKGK